MQLGFPISNYTMSLSLLERIEFWDTNEDAIGEDFHMFVKAYFKTQGQVRSSFAIQTWEKPAWSDAIGDMHRLRRLKCARSKQTR